MPEMPYINVHCPGIPTRVVRLVSHKYYLKNNNEKGLSTHSSVDRLVEGDAGRLTEQLQQDA